METAAHNPWTRKLENVIDLSTEDRLLLDRLVSRPHWYEPGQDLIRQGDIPGNLHVVLDGCAVRYKLLNDGSRQILALLLPGDLCDLNVFLRKEMDHNIGAVIASRVAAIPRDEILEILDARPKLTKALWWSALQDEAIMRERIVGLGRRSAHTRIAHFFYEVYLRLEMVGLASDYTCKFPLTQSELGDTMGLSPVHVNRTVQGLRREGIIDWEGRRLTILDPERLRTLTDFDPDYLHLGVVDGDDQIEGYVRAPKLPRE